MADLHWFPFFAKDWLSSAAVSRMLPEQEGAYIRLLAIMWVASGDTEPHLPNDDAALAQMSRLGKRWKKLGQLIRAQFVERDGLLYNEVLSEVWQEQQGRHAKAVDRARKAGKASGQRRANNKPTPSSPQANYSGMVMDLGSRKDSLKGSAAAPALSERASAGPQQLRNGKGLEPAADVVAALMAKVAQ